MATVNVWEQYFRADHTANEVHRAGALAMLISDSEAGNIRYEAAVTFFPHTDSEDFAVSYDDCFSRLLYEAPGRRSKKREAKLLEELRAVIDDIAAQAGARIFWDEPLRPERRG